MRCETLVALKARLARGLQETRVAMDGTRETVDAPAKGCARVPRSDLVYLLSHPAIAPLASIDSGGVPWLAHLSQRVQRAGASVLVTLEYLRELVDLVSQLDECVEGSGCAACAAQQPAQQSSPTAPLASSGSPASDFAPASSGASA